MFPDFHALLGDGEGQIMLRVLGRGTSLEVQWLKLHLPMQGVWVRSLVRELRSYRPHGQQTKT